MTTFTNVFGGSVIYPAAPSYRAFALSANLTLTWPTEIATDGDVVANIMDVTPSGGGFTIRMPAANLASVGETALFYNPGASTFTVADNGGNTIGTVAAGQYKQLYLAANSTANGTWRIVAYGTGTSSVDAASLAGYGVKAISTTLNQSIPTETKNADYTIGTADRATLFIWTGGSGTLTLPSAGGVGDDWYCQVRNSGVGAITIATPGGETVDGDASMSMNPGDSCFIVCNGSDFYTIGLGQPPEFAFDYVSIDLTLQSSPYTLTGAELNRIAYNFNGVLTVNMEIVVPDTVQQYWCANDTTGAYTLTVKTAAGSGVSVTQSGRNILFCDGTNVLNADTSTISLPIAISQGGTGATTTSAARTNLGGTAVGVAVFTAANEAAGRVALALGTLATANTINGGDWSGTDLAIGDGGTGASLADPGADRIMFWDESANAVTWLRPNVGLATSGTDLNVSGLTLIETLSPSGAASATSATIPDSYTDLYVTFSGAVTTGINLYISADGVSYSSAKNIVSGITGTLNGSIIFNGYNLDAGHMSCGLTTTSSPSFGGTGTGEVHAWISTGGIANIRFANGSGNLTATINIYGRS